MSKPLHKIVKKEALPEFQKDWDRQFATAEAIISRFEENGLDTVLLADEVGMGKTYAALAVAAHHIFQSKENDRKVLLVVPQNNILKRKWEQEIRSFNKRYIQESLRKKGKQIKVLRPLVVNDYWTLIRNLHDFKNEEISRVYEEKKQCFALSLKYWGEKFKKYRQRERYWAATGDMTWDNPAYMGFSSQFSYEAICEFFNDVDAKEAGSMKEIVQSLDSGENHDWRIKDLFRRFCKMQDQYEPNVIVIGMGALGRSRSDHYYAKLLKSYIINLSLKGRWDDTRKWVLEQLQSIVWRKEKNARWDNYLDWNYRLGRTDVWGLKNTIERILSNEEPGILLKNALYEANNIAEIKKQLKIVHSLIVSSKIQESGIGLAIVDEVHNWKNGSNGACDFYNQYASVVSSIN